MTLDEAIKHSEEVADVCEFEASKYDMTDAYESHVACQEGKCAEEHRQLAEWMKELKQLRNQTSWILVSERLPDDETEVLIQYGESMMVGYHIFDYTLYPFGYEDENETGWYDRNDNFICGSDEVIAWQPLPESYKAESEEAQSKQTDDKGEADGEK